jgi:cytochrome c553
MAKMKRKAKLSDDQFDKLTRYFAALRSESTSSTNPAP